MNKLLNGPNKPDWFEYPPDFVAIHRKGIPPEGPWKILEDGELAQQLADLRRNLPGRSLVPFARNESDNVLACFEQNTGVEVKLVRGDATETAEDEGYFTNIDAWRAAVEEMATNELRELLDVVKEDHEYTQGIQWGDQRPGHSEGTIAKHIEELDANHAAIRAELTPYQNARIALLIHVHDTFKGSAQPKVAIDHPQSHASLAAGFLRGRLESPDLVAMVQYHDELYAIWRKMQDRGGALDQDRLNKLLGNIHDLDTFLAFNIVDGVSKGKDRAPIQWAIDLLSQNPRVTLNLNALLSAVESSVDSR